MIVSVPSSGDIDPASLGLLCSPPFPFRAASGVFFWLAFSLLFPLCGFGRILGVVVALVMALN
ncbi:hypothetical protein BGX38DRAFT_1202399 [Terfezia claveryi]|nr:hypothetical protein BGX38DRAFT_1202399 [Terfezia claveryi]